MAIAALASRDYPGAAEHFAARAKQPGPQAIDARIYQAFALMMAERMVEAGEVLASIRSAPTEDQRQALRWLSAMVGARAR